MMRWYVLLVEKAEGVILIKKTKKMFSTRFDEDIIVALNKASKETKLSKSIIIRSAIVEKLHKMGF